MDAATYRPVNDTAEPRCRKSDMLHNVVTADDALTDWFADLWPIL